MIEPLIGYIIMLVGMGLFIATSIAWGFFVQRQYKTVNKVLEIAVPVSAGIYIVGAMLGWFTNLALDIYIPVVSTVFAVFIALYVAGWVYSIVKGQTQHVKMGIFVAIGWVVLIFSPLLNQQPTDKKGK
ncbi:MAG: hypothetical protein FWD89_04490 [Firmicutes bacterium]|nr:hypothetical protein [Bacillota bacterium]